VLEKDVTCLPGQALTMELLPAPAPLPVIEPSADLLDRSPQPTVVATAAPRSQPPAAVPVRTARQAAPAREQPKPAVALAPPTAPAQRSNILESIRTVSAHPPSPPPEPVIEFTPAGGLNGWLLALSIVSALGLGVFFLLISRYRKRFGASTTECSTGAPTPDDSESVFNACESEPPVSNEPEFLGDLRWREMMAAKGFRVFRGKDVPEHFIEIEEVKHERPS